MHWLQTLDVGLFRFINGTLSNSIFDQIMPFVSGDERSFPLFRLGLVLAAAWFICKGGARGRVCLLMLLVAVAVGDGLVCNTIKHAVARPRPFLTLEGVHCLVGRGNSGSLPSSHAANWFAGAMVMFLYYRRSVFFFLPAAALVSFSRIYNGVHYPSDVLAGAILGAGSAVATVWLVNLFWQRAGRSAFPLWWDAMPSLVKPVVRVKSEDEEENLPPPRGAQTPAPSLHASLDVHWARLGYLWIAALLVARFWYIASGTIQLQEDEAYQWLWSKHLALSYYSKPPLIAYTQFLGTAIWGDTAFGVRFFSPLIGAALSLLMLRFFAREVNARAGFILLLVITATPLMAVGTVVMTVDPLSVLFWTAAMLAGSRAVQPNATTEAWLWTGLWMGLGFLSKYTELFQLLCWAVFFVLWPPVRQHLRRAGPWLGLLVHAVCTLPVLIWNAQHGWITVQHVADDAGVHAQWQPTLRYAGEFLGSEFGLLNPIFFTGMVWACIAMWRRGRHNPRWVYFFSMGAPLFLVYLAHSFRSRVYPNWIAPSILPLYCLMVMYWDTRLRLGVNWIRKWLIAGLVLGFSIVILAHDTNLVAKLTGHRLAVSLDVLHRAREWDTTARVVGQVRRELLAEGKPVFIIADHYGMAGEISFYLPEAQSRVVEDPLVYYRTTTRPGSQFYFWPGYTQRKGDSAVFVRELDRDTPTPTPPPPILTNEFESVTDLGVRNVMYYGRVLKPLQFWACRNLQ